MYKDLVKLIEEQLAEQEVVVIAISGQEIYSVCMTGVVFLNFWLTFETMID